MTLLNRHRLWQLAADAAFVAIAWWGAFALRFDGGLPAPYERLFERTLPVVIALQVLVLVLAGVYQHWWRYVSVRDVWVAVRAVAIGSLLVLLAIYLWNPVQGFRVPSAVLALDFLILLTLMAGARLAVRTLVERPAAREIVTRGKEVFVIGAGDAGRLVVKEMQTNARLGYTPIGLVDDNPRKLNMRLSGVRVIGSTHDLPHLLREHRPEEVVIAIPSAAGETRERVVDACREADVPVKTLPAVYGLISGDVDLVPQLRDVQVEDVLGRDPVQLDLGAIASYVAGERVLVTGAGGSIGSEVCRQLAAVGPELMVLVDNGETPLVEIHRELRLRRDFPAAVPVLADVSNRARLAQIFARYRPTVVFHAAAYKHVPLIESNPIEAVRNNVIATQALVGVASEHEVKRFVLISTDKAVNPKNVLGQTKALCEWIVAAAGSAADSDTRFISVRFGNVLGSSGSVIPLFRQQIEAGGPVTVTDPAMTRFFMTIPEAAHLVLHAGSMGETGDVFVLDMGEPVRIVDLAENMIRLSGKDQDADVKIEFIGMRPGEKLHEELWGDGERVGATAHPKILRCSSRDVEPAWLEDELAELERLVDEGDAGAVVERLAEILGQQVASPRAAEMV